MFKTKREPVTVYRSSDEGAPQLEIAPGALKTVLKGCLVTGYGSRQGLGWEAAYEDEHYIALRSKHEQSAKCWLSVDAKYKHGADVCGYNQMTAKLQGTAAFGDSAFAFSIDGNTVNRPWMLIGHPRAFILLIDVNMPHMSYGSYKRAEYLYFGDFHSVSPGRDGCILVKIGRQKTSDITLSSSGSYGLVPFIDHSSSYSARIGAAINLSYDKVNYDVSVAMSSAANVRNKALYPSGITQGFSAFDIYINEYIAGARGFGSESHAYALRGQLGGVFQVMENLRPVPNFQTFDNLDDSGDVFVKFDAGAHGEGESCYLVNCTAWEI